MAQPSGAVGSAERVERSSMITVSSPVSSRAARSASSWLHASVSNAYGGSMKITSNGATAEAEAAYFSARALITRALMPGSHARLRFNAVNVCAISAAAGAADSTATSSRAPRLNASTPNAPVPANRSSTRASSSTPHESRCEKIASLVRSVVGLVPGFGVVNAMPLNRPEITRISSQPSCWSGTSRCRA